jgi:putative transposase
MRKTFQYRIFPTNSQRTLLQGILDACRWVYNKTLETRKIAWEEQKASISRYDTNKLLTVWREEHAFLAHGHAQAMQDAQKHLDLAFRAFFRRVKAGEKPGYPRFRAITDTTRSPIRNKKATGVSWRTGGYASPKWGMSKSSCIARLRVSARP